MRKLNFITNLKSEKNILLHVHEHTYIGRSNDLQFSCRKLFINENIIFTTKATKYIIFHKVF